MLDTPVHRGDAARPKPLQALARVSEYLSVTLRADRGYIGAGACGQPGRSTLGGGVGLLAHWPICDILQ